MSVESGRITVPFCRPDITEAEISEVTDTLKSGWITTGPKVTRFEEEFARYVDAPWAVAVSSCTAGLHLSLVGTGCGEGDEVVTTVNTFSATVAAILHAGARPVLVDIEERSMNMDPDRVEEALSTRTKVILPVHLAGHPCEMDRIRALAEKSGASVVEDAAHSLPASYNGRKIGSLSDLTCFSFYATKNLTTGEGGMVTGLDPEMGERLRTVGYHGMSKDGWKRYTDRGSWYYEIVENGYKYNLPDIAAAIGLVQLRRMAAMQSARERAVQAYQEAFSDLDGLILPRTAQGAGHAWHLYIVRLRAESLRISREEFIGRLSERGIGTSVHFIPIYHHPYYRDTLGLKASDFPVAEKVYSSSVSLPLFSAIRDDEISAVIDAVRDVIKEGRR